MIRLLNTLKRGFQRVHPSVDIKYLYKMKQTQAKLRQVINAIVQEKFTNAEVKIKPISSDGANYSATLFEITIVTPEDTIEMFAKVVDMGDKLDGITNQAFLTEEFVYSTLSNAYDKLQSGHGITDERFIFPKFYKASATTGAHIVVLENLVSKGYECHDRLKCFDWNYASKCVETLAKYHALSFALSKECPEDFKLAGETLKVFEITGSEWDSLTDAALAVLDEVDREKLSQMLLGSVGWSKFVEFGDPRKTAVIIHGDYRPSNLMHKEVNGELHVIPVDYQIAHLGCPATDLIYFIVLGSDQRFRRQYFHQLVDHYYRQLELAMTRLGLEPGQVYGREEFDSDMKEKLPLGLCAAAIVLPFVTVDSADAPNFEQGRFVPRANELFAERFRALVDDFKLWGFI